MGPILTRGFPERAGVVDCSPVSHWPLPGMEGDEAGGFDF